MGELQTISLTDGPVRFAGAIALDVNDDGVQPWRLPADRLDLFHEGLRGAAGQPSGVRLAFVSDTRRVELAVDHGGGAGQFPYDIVIDGDRYQRCTAFGGGNVGFQALPAGEKHIEVWLYQGAPVRIKSLHIDAGATIKPYDDQRPRWLTYGSSITHCRRANGPTETWPAMVASRCDLNLTSLGYGGNCCFDPLVATMIRDITPAPDIITMKLGINCVGGAYSDRTFREAVLGLLHIVREKHTDTPMTICSPIIYPANETTPNAVGMTLTKMREQIAEAVERMQAHGDRHIDYVSGLELMGENELKHMPDLCHPDSTGEYVMADHFAEKVMSRLMR